MSYYDAMREVMDHAIDHDVCNLYFFHVMMGLINNAESEHKFLYDEFMNTKGERIKTENAKLRDLMVEMYGFVRDVCELHPYVLTNAHIPEWQITDHSTPAERYAEKMRELGIEADDD